MPYTVEVEVMHTELADPLALIPQGRRLNVLSVRLRADDINAWPRGRIALLQGYNLFDVPSLIVFCGYNVIIELKLRTSKTHVNH